MSKVKGVVDIVVLLDVTGSMQPCIDAVKQSIGHFIAGLTATDANNENPIRDWRMKVCGYRDHTHNPTNWLIDNPFVRDAASVTAQLSAPSMQADGGGDEPESLLDALFLLASMPTADVQEGESGTKWRDRGEAARIVIFFTDATFKSPMTIPEAVGGTVMDVVNVIMGARIILCGFVPEWDGYYELASADKAEFDVYVTQATQPAIAALGQTGEAGSQATKAAIAALNATVSNPVAFQKVMAQLAKTVTKSAAVELA